MAKVVVDSGICGFSTTITAVSEDMQFVDIEFESTCPHISKAREELKRVDAYHEIFKKPHETEIYRILSQYLPHVSCPSYSGFLKAVEVAAGLALPKDASIKFVE